MPIETITNLMVEIMIMVAIGYVLKKRRIMDDDFQKKISGLLSRVAMPLSVLATGNREFSKEISSQLFGAGGIVVAYYVIALPAVWLLAKVFKLHQKKESVFITLSVFANTAFIGYPLTDAVFGWEGMLYAIVYNLGFQLFLFTIGIRFLDAEQPFDWKEFVRNPLTQASVAAIVIFVSPFRFPTAVTSAFSTVGSLSVPLSMLIIGGNLANIKFYEVWTERLSYIVSVLRLLVFPFAMLFIFYVLGIKGVMPATCVLLTALPPGALNVILAEQYNRDVKFAARSVVQSMVFMFPSLLLVVAALGLIL